MELKFITGEAALMIGKKIVVADLHLGAEHEYRKAGIKMPSQTHLLEKGIIGLIRSNKAKALVILGDVKNRVPGISFQEEKELPVSISKITELAEVEVVLGNHDGGLERLCPGITMHPSEGFMEKGYWLTHGHAWPNEDAMDAKGIIIGHNHPQIEFHDRIGKVWRERAWIRAALSEERLGEYYKKPLENTPELILMPAFSTLVGGWALNKTGDEKRQHKNSPEGFGPLMKCTDIKHAKAYLLDGTYLGPVGKLNQ